MTDEPIEVTVTGPEGHSLKLPVRNASQTAEIAADLLIYGNAFIRQDPQPYQELMGIGISEMLQQNLDEWKGDIPDGLTLRLTRNPRRDRVESEQCEP